MKTLLKNGKIIDGSKDCKPFVSDVLIDDNIISKIAKDIDISDCDEVIDCTDLCIAPGFIDAHSHNDFFYDYDDSSKYYRPFIEQGITTQITGNCGFSPFGISHSSQYKDKVGGGLFHAKNPGSFVEFLDGAKNNIYVNMVPLIGHGTTRISISGYKPEPLSQDDINKEMELVTEAMQNGAFGGSFGFMYEPGIYSKKEELIAFAKEIAKYDGILTIHPRACSKVALGYPLIGKPHIELALKEVVDIMKEAGVRTEYSHLIFVGESSWPSCEPMLKLFHDLQKEGHSIGYDNYSFSYGASVITVVLPPWYMELSKEARKKPFNMFKLKLMTNITKKLLGLDFSDFTVAYIGENYKQYEGKTIDVIAKEENATLFDTYIKLVDLSNGQGRLYLDKYYNEEIIEKLMKDDMSIFMTDAWVEEAGTQNISAYQCFSNFLYLSKKYNIPVENVVHKMTGATADRYKLPLRGYLKEGYFADMTIFDLDKIDVDKKVPDKKPNGFSYVFINGNKVLDKGKYINNKCGEVILKK